MKSIFLVLMLVISTSLFSQQTTPVVNTDYLKKSKSQKTTAKIIAGVGAAVSLTGVLLIIDDVGGSLDPNDRVNTKAADVLTYTGLVVMAVSIPFLIASSKNKKKAAAVSFKMERIPGFQQRSFVYHSYPALSLKIGIQ